MFIVGLKRLERERGSGWLDCPNCHEHALQDVVDAMRFAALGFFRFTPVQRRRQLICRRCGFRRDAEDSELDALETMGRPLRRAWFVPFGVISILVLLGVAYFAFASPSQGSSILGVSFTKLDAQQLLPATLDVPQNWDTTFFTKPDDQPPPRVEITTTSTGLEKIVLARQTDSSTIAQAIVNHFSDETSIESTGFPSDPPKASCAKLGGATAAYVRIPFSNAGNKSEIIMYAFTHGGATYTLTFVASGSDNITTINQVADHAVSSFRFTSGSAPSVSATPSASPSPTPASGGPSPSATPTYSVSC